MAPDAERPWNTRRRARAFLNDLLRKQRNRCYWCDERIVRLKSVGMENVVAIQRGLGRVAYRGCDGKIHRARVATTDHVCPISKGGSSNECNLVAACYECNQDRNQLVQFGAGRPRDYRSTA